MINPKKRLAKGERSAEWQKHFNFFVSKCRELKNRNKDIEVLELLKEPTKEVRFALATLLIVTLKSSSLAS